MANAMRLSSDSTALELSSARLLVSTASVASDDWQVIGQVRPRFETLMKIQSPAPCHSIVETNLKQQQQKKGI